MAIAMQQRLPSSTRIWRSRGIDEPFQTRMGINTGYCNVGNFGSDDRMAYTIVGAEANLAARLQTIAQPGGIVLSYETYSLVKRHGARAAARADHDEGHQPAGRALCRSISRRARELGDRGTAGRACSSGSTSAASTRSAQRGCRLRLMEAIAEVTSRIGRTAPAAAAAAAGGVASGDQREALRGASLPEGVQGSRGAAIRA